jgi:hypothetical protein
MLIQIGEHHLAIGRNHLPRHESRIVAREEQRRPRLIEDAPATNCLGPDLILERKP